MSRTLFWYILKDLLRIFLMASGALAGIMSFGGLLKPLTEHGLSAGQVGRMLTYFTPAMTTYSFPVAALFAAVMVYGRLSADNELTACRATGISYLSLTAPALVLGLCVSVVSLAFLCFVVPLYTLKVEQTVYSNLAQLMQNKIEQTHQIKFETANVFALAAKVVDDEPAVPGDPHAKDQHVRLDGPMIVSYTLDPKLKIRVPATFDFASTADVYLRRRGDKVEFEAVMTNPSTFARDLKVKPKTQAERTQIGPFKFDSPVREDTKFMNIVQLKDLFNYPEKSRKLKDEVHGLVRQVMTQHYLETLRDELNERGTLELSRTDKGPVTVYKSEQSPLLIKNGSELVVRSWQPGLPPPKVDPKLQPKTQPKGLPKGDSRGGAESARVRVTEGDSGRTIIRAQEVRVTVDPQFVDNREDDPEVFDEPHVVVEIDGFDAQIRLPEEGSEPEDEAGEEAEHRVLKRQYVVPMSPAIARYQSLTVRDLVGDEERKKKDKPAAPEPAVAPATVPVASGDSAAAHGRAKSAPLPAAPSVNLSGIMVPADGRLSQEDINRLNAEELKKLKFDRHRLVSKITAEIHGRASFSIACLVLVIVGSALGMLFRSGNFLSAFTVSFVPALLSIALIVTGQQICGNTNGSLTTGLAFIWAGNATVLTLGLILLGKLQRQ